MEGNGYSYQNPERDQTLAGKQQEKIQRTNHRLSHWVQFPAEWWVSAGEIGGLFLLLVANFLLLRPFWGQPDQTNVFSAPLIPFMARLSQFFVSYDEGVRFWLMFFLLALPFSLYFFVREVSGRKIAGLMAAFAVSFPVEIFLPVRVRGVLGIDGPYMASLAFIPLVCLVLWRFLRQGNFPLAVLAALGMVLVALTSPLGLLVLFIFALIVTFSEILLGSGRLKIIRFLIILVFAIGFSAFWYNPKFVILTVDSEPGRLIINTFFNLLPFSLFLVPVLGVFGFLLFENRTHLQGTFVALFLTFIFGLLSLGMGIPFASASRFLPALGISVAILLGVGLVWLFNFLRFSAWLWLKLKRFAHWQEAISFGLIWLFVGSIAGTFLANADNLLILEESQVLGAFDPPKAIGFWEIRRQTSQLETIFGYLITALSVLGVVILGSRLPKK